MNSTEHLNDLQDIKRMMEKSSRFISLSGWSGISAGCCALIGAFFAHDALQNNYYSVTTSRGGSDNYFPFLLLQLWQDKLFHIAVMTFIAALVSSFVFTYIRSRKNDTPVWSITTRRLMTNICIPLVAGGIFLLKLLENGAYGLIAPGCLIFYGLALVNGSKYTLSQIRYLGLIEIFLGLVSCWFIGLGLYFWAVGFGIMHIIYGIVMLVKYEKNV